MSLPSTLKCFFDSQLLHSLCSVNGDATKTFLLISRVEKGVVQAFESLQPSCITSTDSSHECCKLTIHILNDSICWMEFCKSDHMATGCHTH